MNVIVILGELYVTSFTILPYREYYLLSEVFITKIKSNIHLHIVFVDDNNSGNNWFVNKTVTLYCSIVKSYSVWLSYKIDVNEKLIIRFMALYCSFIMIKNLVFSLSYKQLYELDLPPMVVG